MDYIRIEKKVEYEPARNAGKSFFYFFRFFRPVLPLDPISEL